MADIDKIILNGTEYNIGGVPTNVKTSIYNLLNASAYASTGHSSDIATVQSWATGLASYSITNTLSNCTNSNASTSIEQGSSYSATLTANTHYTLSSVTVTMGGVNVTNTVYNNGTISISSVTGDIVITAVAYIYTYDTNDETINIYTGASSQTSMSPYNGRIINDVTSLVTKRRSIFSPIENGLPVVRKTGSNSFEVSDYYLMVVPPDVSSVTVTMTTSLTEPQIGMSEVTLSGTTYSYLQSTGWVTGTSLTEYSVAEGTEYLTLAFRKDSSDGVFADNDISRVVVAFS